MISTTKYDVMPIIVPENKTSLKSINFFLLKDEHSLTLIDAGLNNEECWEALQQALKELDCTLQDLSQIILTHHHTDHVGLVNRIIEFNPTTVYCHPLSIPRLKRDPEFLEKRVEFFAKLYEEMGCGEAGKKQVDYLQKALVKNKSQAIDYAFTEITDDRLLNFEVLETPGHAPDQVALYDNKNKWLFAGDLLIEHISSNALVEPDPFGRRMKTIVEHENSMKKCLHLELSLIYSGHGNIIKEPKTLIQKRLDGIERKAEKFLALLKAKKATGSELAQDYYKELYSKQFSLVMSEVIGHLDYLETHGKIEKERINGVWYYSAKI